MSDGLSGGESQAVCNAGPRALYTEPDILLLDEPTNHMDMPTIEWMEEMLLRQHRGALLVVSHDRAFLRNLGTGIVWLHQGKLRRREWGFRASLMTGRKASWRMRLWCCTRWTGRIAGRDQMVARGHFGAAQTQPGAAARIAGAAP